MRVALPVALALVAWFEPAILPMRGRPDGGACQIPEIWRLSSSSRALREFSGDVRRRAVGRWPHPRHGCAIPRRSGIPRRQR